MGDDESIVVIATYGQATEAHIAKLKLESEGIEAVLHDENIVATYPLNTSFTGGIKLLVKKSQAKQSCEILGTQNNDINCPECDSDDCSMSLLSNIMWALAGLVTLRRGVGRTMYKCNACGHSWYGRMF